MQQVGLRDYCEEARLLIQSGEPHKAIHITRHILRHYPRHVESYRLLGQALLAAGLHQEAARQFRRVLSADPEDVSSRVGLAEIHRATGDLDKAIWHMQRAVELSPGDSDLRARLGQLYDSRQGDGRPETFEITRAALGRIHVRAGLHAKAVQEFKAVLEGNPDRGDVQTALAEIYWRTGDHLGAVEVCQRILEKLPNALKANLMLGALWLENQQPDEAQPYLGLAQELDPESLVAQSLFGEASPLPPLEVKIEPLGEHELQSVQFGPPPTSPHAEVPASQEQELAIDWMSESHEEGSKPMSDEERADEEFELPDWLKGVGDDLLGESDDQPASSSPPELDSDQGEETPDWLRDLVARVEEPDASEESVPAEPGDVPDWLQELRPEVPEETPSDSDTPIWLESQPPDDLYPTQPEVPEEEGVEEAPPVEEPEAPVMPVAEAGVDEAGVPSWLEEVQEGETLPQPDAEQPVEELPPSLLEPLSDVVEESDVPDWLRDISAGESVPSEEAEPATRPVQPTSEIEVEEAGLPDWLLEFEEPAAEEEGVGPELITLEVADQPTATADEGRAMWEQILDEEGVDLASVEEAPPPEAAGMTAEEWLRSTADLEGREPAAEEPPVEELEEPAIPVAEAEVEWLEDIGEPAEEEAYPAAEVTAEAYQADLPDWLRQVAAGEPFSEEAGEPAAEAEPAEEVSDWMRELQEPVVEEEVAETVEVEVDEAGLPDWLREPSVEAAEFVEPEIGPPAETPEWLTELESEDMLLAESEFEEPIELETGEMPEWLGEVLAGEPSLAEEWTAEPAEAEAGEEQIPEWLREFREREREIEPGPAGEIEELEVPAEAGAEAEYAGPPELPDWLLHLREGVRQGEIGFPPVEEPVVAEEEEFPAVEAIPTPEEERVEEVPPVVTAEPELEPVEFLEPVEALAPEPESIVTRELEVFEVAELPKEPTARLSLARAAFNAGDWNDALMIYETLVNSSEMLDSVIDNLEVGVRRYPDDPAGYQLLGDACMKDGRLHAALDAYRMALSRL